MILPRGEVWGTQAQGTPVPCLLLSDMAPLATSQAGAAADITAVSVSLSAWGWVLRAQYS